ncbi:unnamed protein product [Bursaphelenchus okinawaensis]|uniref:Apple domain-containing protein n=1 Tax=Bursaphelenchus okinawaensis TaxID=465554 RepID=A0A811L7U2_9BILA|nr:unnamed protein product [Bursaphelenchus okinawaensis]CAG9118743.1 unnamed protein product [Bursaphelenchus okinawaensis]
MVFKRRFRDVISQEKYVKRLMNAYQSDRLKNRLRIRRKRDSGILGDCVKSVCMQKRSGMERANHEQLKAFYRKLIGQCIISGGGGTVQRNARQEPRLKDDCFERTEGKVLIGISDQDIKDVSSPQVCERLCATAKKDLDFTCKSAMFYKKEQECILASENRDTMPELYVDDENSIYIHNKCVDKEPPPQTTQQTPQIPFTTTLPLITTQNVNLTKPKHVNIQPSGYDKKTKEETEEQPFEADPDNLFYGIQPPKPKAVIPDEVIDSYGMTNTSTDTKDDNYKQTPVIPDKYGHRRFLDEAPIIAPKCFTRFQPLHVRSIRSRNATSLEECANLCLKCYSCLKGLKCGVVGFSKHFGQCVLAQTDLRWQIKSTAKLSEFVYFKRDDC